MAERTPAEIQRDIDRTRDALAGTLDQIVERAHPKRLIDNGKSQVQNFFESPKGKAVIAGAGALVVYLVGRRISLAKKNKRERNLELLYRYNLLDE
ncbi:DUF3618 domain-containing protein [Cumulibacter manganitolerans]|uniref:DUF3618 domain-containing protein n=1 Tax=Cumulibacter manganitolerans TaxID=1884992 RepID=UPI0012950367|nr:DUF3618 domain-containing protein [Cumulibacter manganitolerans]